MTMPSLTEINAFNDSYIDDLGAIVSMTETRSFKSHGIVWHGFWLEVKDPFDEITSVWMVMPNENWGREGNYPIEFAYREVMLQLSEWGGAYDKDGDLREVLQYLCNPRVKEAMANNEHFPQFEWV